MMFAAAAVGLPLPTINLLAALIYWFINRKKDAFVRFHILQSLYAQIATSLLNITLIYWSVRIFIFKTYEFTDDYKAFIAVTVIANAMYFAFSIVAAVRARQGKIYFFLVFGRLTYLQVYGDNSPASNRMVA